MTETRVETAAGTHSVTPRLKARYADEIKPALLAEFGYTNVMQVPGVVKVVVNMGVQSVSTSLRASDAGPPARW